MQQIIYLDNSDEICFICIAFLLYCTTLLHILQYTLLYVTLVSEPKIFKERLLGLGLLLCSVTCPRKICMLDKKAKDKIIKKFQVHEGDTGSTPIQIAIVTEEIKQLTDHLKNHKKDFSSRRGLLKKVAERRKLLLYLKREEPQQYDTVTKELKLKVAQVIDESEGKKNKLDIVEAELNAGTGTRASEATSSKGKDTI